MTKVLTHFSEPHWPLVNKVATIVKSLDLKHTHCPSVDALLSTLKTITPEHRVLLFTDEGHLDLIKQIKGLNLGNSLNIVVFITSGLAEFMRKASGLEQIKYILGSNGLETIGRDISILIRKFRDGDILDLEKYLAFGASIVRRTVSSKKTKQDVTDAIYRFIANFGDSGYSHPYEEYARRVSDMVDEMLINAIYHEKSKLKPTEQSLDFTLAPKEQVAVAWGYDGEYFGVSVQDPFGTFTQAKMEKSLSSQRSIDDILTENRGGLGLKIIFETAHQVIANVKPQTTSELIVLIRFDSRMSTHEKRKKSFFYFTDEN